MRFFTVLAVAILAAGCSLPKREPPGLAPYARSAGASQMANAIRKHRLDWVKRVFDLGIGPNDKEFEKPGVPNSGLPLLTTACASGDMDIVKEFMSRGADVNITGAGGTTPLIAAAPNSAPEPNSGVTVSTLQACLYILDHGARADATNDLGMSALFESTSPTLTKALIAKGADVNRKDRSGFTALIMMSDEHCPDVMEVLVDHGADVNAKGNDGTTALIALMEGYTEQGVSLPSSAERASDLKVAKLLVNHGADSNARDHTGNSALSIARRWKLVDFEAVFGGVRH